MEPSRGQRRYVITEQPLAARDYDVPVGWWGWNWEPPVPMSITEILQAGNMDARTAALVGMTIEAHGSLRSGYALGSTLHADSADEAVAQLTGELGVAPDDLGRVHLLMVMRIYATSSG